jgi:hypothetical protein
MAAELGQTQDPKALIPGDPDALNVSVEKFTIFADALITAGEGFRDIQAQGWDGLAAQKAQSMFEVEPPKWLKAGDALNDAASALSTYADALLWAQGKAAEAIRLWNEGQAATEKARQDHARAVEEAAGQAAESGAAPVEVPFHDPGAEPRAAATDLLNRTRQQLLDAGDIATAAIERARDQAPEKPGWFGQTMGMFEDFLYGVRDGANESFEAVWSFGEMLAEDPSKFDDAVEAMGTNIASAVSNPQEAFAKVTDWNTWKESPGRAVGHLIIDAIGGGPVKRVAAGLAAGRVAAGDGPAPPEDKRRGYEPTRNRVKLRAQTKRDIYMEAEREADGDFVCAATEETIPARRYPDGSPVLINPQTGKPDPNGMSVPQPGEFNFGHKPGEEWWRYKIEAEENGYTRKQVIEDQNDPSRYRIETPEANRSHRYEHPG